MFRRRLFSAGFASVLVSLAAVSVTDVQAAHAVPLPNLTSVTTNADWHVVTTSTGGLMGLSGDGAGNLDFFDTVPRLAQVNATAAQAALHGVAVPSSGLQVLTPSNYAANIGNFWVAGVVPLSSGQILFDSAYSNEIDLLTAPGSYSAAYVNGWLDEPTGMAMSPSGDALYVANSGPTRPGVYRVPVVGSSFDWAGATRIVSGLHFAQQIRVGSNGTLYIADTYSDNIYSMTSAQIASVVNGAPALSPGSGLGVVATGPLLNMALGLALDASGNLYFSVYTPWETSTLANGGKLAIGEIPATWLNSGQTATAYNGGIVDILDTHAVSSVDGGVQPIDVVNGVLYVGSNDTGKIYAYALSGVPHVANATVQIVGGNLSATWGGVNAQYYRCTLMNGFNSPTSFSVTTRSSNCTFYGASTPTLGVRITAFSSQGLASASVVVFPSPYTITCVRSGTVRHVTGVDPTCPTGWRQR